MPRLRPADGSGGRRARPPDPLAGGGGRSGCKALPLAGAALPLTCRAAPVNPFNARVAGYARGGASLTTFGFVTIVPRYLPLASNSLTFVRGAYRAYLCRKNGYGD